MNFRDPIFSGLVWGSPFGADTPKGSLRSMFAVKFFLQAVHRTWAAPQVLNRVCLFPLPPLHVLLVPFPTLPPPSFPPFPSPPYLSRVEGSESHLPPPSLSLPSLFPFPWGSHPLNQLGGLGSAINSPSGVWGEAPADKRFGAYLGQKAQLWWQHFLCIS